MGRKTCDCRETYLDTDEICLTLIGNGLGQQRLTSTRRSIEENTFAGRHSILQELLGMLDRVLDGLL
jgi:hypothetical protein